MVFFNYATMQMAAKIVYYGPGLCGKTTNLHIIYGRTAPNSRGEMVSLETETDRTLFFDLLPLDVGVIGGFKTRLQLYTVPGQVFYNTTRKLVLKGVDGMVFVADSQRPMLDPNRESLKNLRENLAEIGLNLDDIPRVFQYNKRDLANILSVDELNDALNPDRSAEWYEASARNGTGVFETLKAISKLTLKALKGKMSGGAEGARPAVVATPATPANPVPALSAEAPKRASLDDVRAAVARAGRPFGKRESGDKSMLAKLANFSALAANAPVAEPEPPPQQPQQPQRPPARPAPAEVLAAPFDAPFEEPLPRPGDSSADISFGEEKAAPEPAPAVTSNATAAVAAVEASVKHVKVRSSIDILSELDKLRKVSTQKPTGATGTFPAVPLDRPKSTPGMAIDDLLSSGLNHKKDVSRSFDVAVPRESLQRTRVVSIGLRFKDESGSNVGPEKSLTIEVANLRDIQKLLLSLRVNVQGE